MSEIRATFEAGLAEHRAGQLLAAEKHYRRVLELYPRHAEAVHLLGLIAFQVGKTELAAQYVEQAVKLDRFRAPFSADLGQIYRALGRGPEAIAAYRRALELDPKSATAQAQLGTLLEAEGDSAAALECYRQALAIDASCADAQAGLGRLMLAQQQVPAAQAALEQAVRLAPDNAAVYCQLGECLQSQGKLLEAIACFQKAARLDPDSAAAHFQLAHACQLRGQLEQAAAHYRRTIELAPQMPEAFCNLATVCRELGHAREAIASYEKAIACRPQMFAAHLGLSSLHAALVHPDRAVDAARRAVELRPESAAAAGQLARGLQLQGDASGAVAAFRRAVELNPADAKTHSELLSALAADPAFDGAALLTEHRAWALRHAEPLTAAARAHQPDRTPQRRLRVGYVSPHFRQHASNAFTLPLLAAHDRENFEFFAYSDSMQVDDATTRFQQAIDHWRPVAGLTDEAAANLIRDDRIDILVDLAGHLGNRLAIFARKPAPIQASYFGYPSTTAMSAMDYRLTDAVADPPDVAHRYYTERLVRLPRCGCCYARPEPSPEINPLPALAAGQVTLAWLAGTMRTTREAVDFWVRLLSALPSTRLIVMAYRNGVFEQHVREALARGGVDPARVEVTPGFPTDELLRLHQRIDLALDSFPLSNPATLCHSLWMGVPCVVRELPTRVSRLAGSILTSAGLAECIAHSEDEHLQVVANLIGDLPRLAELRSRLRANLSASAVTDAPRLARNLENAYRQMWRAWCDRA